MPRALVLFVVVLLALDSGRPAVPTATVSPPVADLVATPSPSPRPTATPDAPGVAAPTHMPPPASTPEVTAIPEVTPTPGATATPAPAATPVATDAPSPTEEWTPEPPETTGTAGVDIVVTLDRDGVGPKPAAPASSWLVSWMVVTGDDDDVAMGEVRTGEDGRASISVVTGPELQLQLWDDVRSGWTELGSTCVDTDTGTTVDASPFEFVQFTPVADGHYACTFANATETAGVFVATAFERTGVRAENRDFNTEFGVVVEISVDGGYPDHLTQASDDEGWAGTPIWLVPGHRSARVTVSERVPAGQVLIDGGCHLNDIRSDGVQALIDPWDVPMRHGRISLTVDRWHGAGCVFVNAPSGVVPPQADAASGRTPSPLALLALVAALGWLATRRRASRACRTQAVG